MAEIHGERNLNPLVVCFWVSIASLTYIYAGYPLLVWTLGRLFPGRVERARYAGPLSIVIAGYNEGSRLAKKLESLFASDCASQIAEVLIGSDGSDDNTAEVIAAFGDPRVRLVAFAERRGKPAVLNDLVPQCHSPLVILTDARQALDPQALSLLAACFADQSVASSLANWFSGLRTPTAQQLRGSEPTGSTRSSSARVKPGSARSRERRGRCTLFASPCSARSRARRCWMMS